MKCDRAKKLEQIALEVRKDLVRMASVTGMKYLSSSLSMADLIVYIYWEVMSRIGRTGTASS
jgi:transketolase N-terminal domain/subunit